MAGMGGERTPYLDSLLVPLFGTRDKRRTAALARALKGNAYALHVDARRIFATGDYLKRSDRTGLAGRRANLRQRALGSLSGAKPQLRPWLPRWLHSSGRTSFVRHEPEAPLLLHACWRAQ